MLARARSKLTYANVMATLALFVALGGTGYAASQITGRDIKNRSITRADVKKNTLTGAEINERRLGRVPRARAAQSAQSAATATSAVAAASATFAAAAGSAARADSAGVANLANSASNADNAQNLAGQGPAAFEQSTTVQSGSASAAPSSSSGEQVLLSWPELGVQVASSSQDCGGAAQFAIRNTKSSGSVRLFQDNQADGTVPAGSTDRRCSVIGSDAVDAEVTDASGRTLFVDCVVADGRIRCLGIRGE